MFFFFPVTKHLPQRGEQRQKQFCLKRKEEKQLSDQVEPAISILAKGIQAVPLSKSAAISRLFTHPMDKN